jgi:hypothetical protein
MVVKCHRKLISLALYFMPPIVFGRLSLVSAIPLSLEL